MTPTVRKRAGSAALILALGGAAVGTGFVWKKYGGLNPYASIEKKKRPFNPSAVIQASGVKMRHYENGKLVVSADAKSLTIGQDRNMLTLKGVKNGVAQTPQGPIQFAGKLALVSPNLKMVNVVQGVRVKGGNDFDVSSTMATIDGKNGVVTVPSPLRGTIGGGQFSAASMVHKMNSDYTKIVSPEWTGRLGGIPAATALPTQMQSKVWTFRGNDMSHGREGSKDPVEMRQWYAENGWASDGEMVVTAPHLVRDPKTEVVTATSDGGVRATYHSAKADIVADKVVVYHSEKKAVCTGHVLVYVRPKKEWDKPLTLNEEDRGPLVPDIPPALMAKMGDGAAMSQTEKDKVEQLRSGKNLRDYPMQLSAEEVTYWYQEGQRHAIAKNGTPTAFQKFDDGHWRQAWAPEAHYDGEKDVLELIGDKTKRQVHLKNSLADVTDCYNAKLSTKEDQTEEDGYMYLKDPKGHGIDFDNPSTDAKGGTPPANGATPPKGGPPAGGGTPPPAKPGS